MTTDKARAEAEWRKELHEMAARIHVADEWSREDVEIELLSLLPALTAHAKHAAEVKFLGVPYKTTDGVVVGRWDAIGYCYEALDGYTRWSGKIIPIKFSTWLDKDDPDWKGHPSGEFKRKCPDGRWGFYSTREAAEAARIPPVAAKSKIKEVP